jgi:CRP-like cAMP-binding protein
MNICSFCEPSMIGMKSCHQPLISYVAKYVNLSNADKQVICDHVQCCKYVRGQFLVEQGGICQFENFVTRGCVRTYCTDEKGHEHTVMFAIENWWTADLGSFITQRPADYNVQCLEDTEVAQITHSNLEKLYALVPKLERFFRIIIQRAFVSAQKRIVGDFSIPARERYLLFLKQYPQIEQRVPQYMIASYLGITKQFLSKIRRQPRPRGS